MSDFGDFEPEDEYDASDPIPIRLFVIGQIVAATDHIQRRRALARRLLLAIAEELDNDG